MTDLISPADRRFRVRMQHSKRLVRTAALSFSLVGWLCGCAYSSYLRQVSTPSYQPSNVYREEASLAPNIRRVAVLPLAAPTDESAMEFGREALWPVLLNELGRVRQFELVSVTAEDLRLMTGRSTWGGEEKLPLDFFESLKEKLGVDAILFSRLTQYRAYEPLSVGWRLKLLDADEPRILWAVDEVFDARVPEVAAAAIRYDEHHPDTSSSLRDSRGVLASPSRFGRYAASAVVQTLPARQPASH